MDSDSANHPRMKWDGSHAADIAGQGVGWAGCLLGFHGFGCGFPDGAWGLGVEQLIPQAATDQVGPL